MMLNKVSLNTIGLNRIGLNRIGKPSRASSDRPYIDPEVLASLKAVCICYGKSNDDPDRAVVKNLVDPDNPFIISNAAFKLNSGYGKYEEDFTSWNSSSYVSNIRHDSFDVNKDGTNVFVLYKNIDSSSSDTPSFKIKVSNLINSIIYAYINDSGVRSFFKIKENGEYILPKSYNSLTPTTTWIGFRQESDVNCECTITQIPSFEGAFVTDGIDDLITSTKTVQEMLGGSNEITVISMIHHINADITNPTSSTFNNVRNASTVSGRNILNTSDPFNKTGIYGWSRSNLNTTQNSTLIVGILGDDKDYKVINNTVISNDSKYYVEGYATPNYIAEVSQVAWYWTIIANKVLTTDQINQVIAYFNLDKTLKPDILCNTIKQGISNENHAEFGDKLIDFSGNGRDIQLNNIAWDGDSGIGKYNYPNWKVNVTQGNKYARIVYYDSINGTYSADFKGMTDLYKSYGLSVEIRVNRANTVDYHSIKEDGIYTVTPPDDTTSIDIRFGGENVYNASCDITITQIPSHAGALCLDGVNDFGKVTGMPIYKDYTIVVDYERISGREEALISKAYRVNQGAFVLMETSGTAKHSYSFGAYTAFNRDDFTRTLLYQSKYKCGDVNLTIGKGIDGDTLWLGTLRDNDYRFFNGAIYSLMSFPYSMSEFLIERQLKKHKLGTLYPNMVEFRPIVKSNLPYSSISYSVNPGEYISVDSMVTITVTLPNTSDKLMEVSCNAISDISISGDNGVYEITGKVGKSPQKINMIISSYLTMLGNETLISNETLIKNE